MATFSKDHSDNFLNSGQFVAGDLTNDNDLTVASGAGSVAASEGSFVNAATGDAAIANLGGDVNQALGARSQIVDGPVFGNNASNSDGAIQAGGDISGANSGVNTGVVAGGGVDRTIVGDDNAQFSVDGHVSDSALSFGGDASNVSDNIGFGSSFNAGGDSQSFIGNSADDGGAIGGRDASGFNLEDNDVSFREDNTAVVSDSQNVNLGQDDSTAFAHQDFDPIKVDIDDSVLAGDDVEDNFFDN